MNYFIFYKDLNLRCKSSRNNSWNWSW